MLGYLARYTHRVAISNSRLIAADESGVTFKYKDYRIEGPARYKTMTLQPGEFIRRFMLHVLPKGFHRIRHYGLFASGPAKATTIERARELIAAAAPAQPAQKPQADDSGGDDRETGASLPVLRRAHGDHRDVRGRTHAASSADHDAGRNQDRHVMMVLATVLPVTAVPFFS